ncbi:MAG: outer membrane protein assembly factor BamD [Pseudomonadota bacterium]
MRNFTLKQSSSRSPITLLLSAMLALTLAGCSWIPFFGKDKETDQAAIEAIDTTEQKVYREAQSSLRSGNYQQAIAQLELLEARFPFGRYAEQAQLELVFARYMSFDLDGAKGAAERFIRLHPQHSNVDYAYYIKGLSAYSQNQSLMDRFFEPDYAKRDMTPVREAYADFAQLLARYPDSPYVADTKQRMIHLRNLLAQSELGVADYYLRRNAFVAAAKRAKYVLEVYPQSESTADALVVLIESNYKLGLTDEANNALRVLAINYPNYSAFDEQGNLVLDERIRNRDRSWTNIMTLGLFDRPEVPPPLKIQHPEGFQPPAVQPQPESRDTEKKRGWFSWLPFIS